MVTRIKYNIISSIDYIIIEILTESHNTRIIHKTNSAIPSSKISGAVLASCARGRVTTNGQSQSIRALSFTFIRKPVYGITDCTLTLYSNKMRNRDEDEESWGDHALREYTR